MPLEALTVNNSCCYHSDVTHVGADDDRHPLDHVHKYLALPSLEVRHEYINLQTYSPAGIWLLTGICLRSSFLILKVSVWSSKCTTLSTMHPGIIQPPPRPVWWGLWADVYLLSAGLDGSGGSRAWSHFTLLCLCSKLQTNNKQQQSKSRLPEQKQLENKPHSLKRRRGLKNQGFKGSLTWNLELVLVHTVSSYLLSRHVRTAAVLVRI